MGVQDLFYPAVHPIQKGGPPLLFPFLKVVAIDQLSASIRKYINVF